MNTKLLFPPKGFCGLELSLYEFVILLFGTEQSRWVAEKVTGEIGLLKHKNYWFAPRCAFAANRLVGDAFRILSAVAKSEFCSPNFSVNGRAR